MKKFIYLSCILANFLSDMTNSLSGVDWIGPIDVFSAAVAENPVVGVDSNGNAVILITASDDETTYYEEGAQLINGIVQNLHQYTSMNTIQNGTGNAIAVNANGNAAMMWFERDNTTMALFARAAVLTNNSWGTPLSISDSVNYDAIPSFEFGMTISDSTQAIAVWDVGALNNSDEFIQTSQYISPSWSNAQNLNDDTTDNITGALISGSPSGQAMAIWSDSSTTGIVNAGYYNGTSWNNFEVSTDSQQGCTPPQAVSMNSSNQAMVIWQNNSLGGISSSFFSGGIFGSAQTVYTPVTGDSIQQIGVALSDNENAMALWILTDMSGEYKLLASLNSNGSWNTPALLDIEPSSGALVNLNIGMDKDGNAYAVWEKDDGLGNNSIFFSEYTQAVSSWSDAVQLSPISVSATEPNLSMNAFGGATVVWMLGGEGDTIQAVYTPNTIGPNPPTNLTGAQIKNRFPFQIDLVNQLNWLASTTTSVSVYNILRDGVQIGSVQATEPLIYLDHNRKKGSTYTYQVIAVGSNGLQSTPVTVVLP